MLSLKHIVNNIDCDVYSRVRFQDYLKKINFPENFDNKDSLNLLLEFLIVDFELGAPPQNWRHDFIYHGMKIDAKRLEGQNFNVLQGKLDQYIESVNLGELTHFLFYKTNGSGFTYLCLLPAKTVLKCVNKSLYRENEYFISIEQLMALSDEENMTMGELSVSKSQLSTTPMAARVLQECIDLQLKKAQDYQNPASTVRQADYYPRGISSIYDIMHGKMLRIKSIMETMENDPSFIPNHESLRDSAKDLINYASFFAVYLDKGIPGQNPDANEFNKVK